MKRFAQIVGLFVALIPFVLLQAAEAATVQMKLGHFAAEPHAGNMAVKMFIEAVEKRSNGEIKIANFPNNALGSPPEVLEQNILGAHYQGISTSLFFLIK